VEDDGPVTDRTQIIDEMYKQARRNYPRRKFITYGIDDVWQADLVEMNYFVISRSGKLKRISEYNKGYKYILNIIDTFSKYAWAVPLKNKTSEHVANAFKNILVTENRSPSNLQTDKGKEFYNKVFKELMKNYNINHYSTYTIIKASIVERFNRTQKSKIETQLEKQSHYRWVDILPKLMKTYNNTKHSTIKRRPVDVNLKN
jgi:hypothetical protein